MKLLPTNRVRDSKGFPLADAYTTHTQVLCPGARGGYVRVWVKIQSGTCQKGSGVVEESKSPAVKFGAVITYSGGSEDMSILPKLERKRHVSNQRTALVEPIAKQLEASMVMRPEAPIVLPQRPGRHYVPERVMAANRKF